jgi:uncharacterized FlgJ-related protein
MQNTRLRTISQPSAGSYGFLLLAWVLMAASVRAQVSPPALPELEPQTEPEVIIVQGVEQAQQFLMSESWWGEINRGEQLEAPRILLTSIPPGWQESSQELPVESKKEFFYRFALPLILHANELIRERRAELLALLETINAGRPLSATPYEFLAELASSLEVLDGELPRDAPGQQQIIDAILYRLDEVPAGLALGQAAYESGYGTSRFAVQGNALFGQWTFDGSGMTPEAQRESLGDYRIATYNWPFDSVRAYMLNLSRHPAYEEFRRLRAAARDSGQPLDSIELTAGLVNYSERGQEYVDTLRSIIEVNNLAVADAARLRDEPIRYLIGTGSDTETRDVRAQVDQMRDNGELSELIERMELD